MWYLGHLENNHLIVNAVSVQFIPIFGLYDENNPIESGLSGYPYRYSKTVIIHAPNRHISY